MKVEFVIFLFEPLISAI